MLLELRRKAREFYPNLSRHKRAEWVLAALHAKRIGPRVPISTLNDADPNFYRFARTA